MIPVHHLGDTRGSSSGNAGDNITSFPSHPELQLEDVHEQEDAGDSTSSEFQTKTPTIHNPQAL